MKNYYNRILLSFAWGILSSFVLPQYTNIDSFLHVAQKTQKSIDWNNVALCYEEIGDTAQLRICAHKAYQLALSENDLAEKGHALLRQGAYEEYCGNLNKAIEKSALALECFREFGYFDYITEATSVMSNL